MILINGKPLITDSVFSGGELNIKLPNLDLKKDEDVYIDYRSKNPNDLLKLGLIVNAIRNNYAYLEPKISLNTPYLPYARQDRICSYGEAYGLQFVLDYLSTLGFSTVFSRDVHSDIYTKLKGNNSCFRSSAFINSSNFAIQLYELGIQLENLVRVSPDAGALGRIKAIHFDINRDYYSRHYPWYDFYRYYKASSILEVEKQRIDGGVKSTIKTLLPIENCNLMIIDDICDGGATFIDLAKQLNKCSPKSITLFVTHGIFRFGTSDLYDAGITRIITTDSLPQTLTNHKGEFHVFKV